MHYRIVTSVFFVERFMRGNFYEKQASLMPLFIKIFLLLSKGSVIVATPLLQEILSLLSKWWWWGQIAFSDGF